MNFSQLLECGAFNQSLTDPGTFAKQIAIEAALLCELEYYNHENLECGVKEGWVKIEVEDIRTISTGILEECIPMHELRIEVDPSIINKSFEYNQKGREEKLLLAIFNREEKYFPMTGHERRKPVKAKAL